MTKSAIDSLTGDLKDIHLVHLYQEQLSDFKRELGHIHHKVTSQCTQDVSDELHTQITTLDKSIFDMSLKVNKFLYNPVSTPEAIISAHHESKGVHSCPNSRFLHLMVIFFIGGRSGSSFA